jgi:polyisoprenoid-binding protein YceI
MEISFLSRALIIVLFFITSISAQELAPCKDSANKYMLDSESIKIGWTAFKTTEKLAVNGEFTVFKHQEPSTSCSIATLLKNLEFSIDSNSVSTQNPERDQTLKDYFFSKLLGSITGKVKNVSEKDRKFTLNLNLNQKSKDIEFVYKVEADNLYTATAVIDLLDFAGQAALESINKQCYDLHKGADGISKTWSEVVVNLSGKINKKSQV